MNPAPPVTRALTGPRLPARGTPGRAPLATLETAAEPPGRAHVLAGAGVSDRSAGAPHRGTHLRIRTHREAGTAAPWPTTRGTGAAVSSLPSRRTAASPAAPSEAPRRRPRPPPTSSSPAAAGPAAAGAAAAPLARPPRRPGPVVDRDHLLGVGARGQRRRLRAGQPLRRQHQPHRHPGPRRPRPPRRRAPRTPRTSCWSAPTAAATSPPAPASRARARPSSPASAPTPSSSCTCSAAAATSRRSSASRATPT